MQSKRYHRFTKIILLAVILVLPISKSYAQSYAPDTSLPSCIVVMPNPTSTFNVPTLTTPSSLVSCSSSGRIKAYFEEVDLSLYTGFNDLGPAPGTLLSLGAVRRNCVCQVLSDLENVFVLDPSITSTNPLIIKFGSATFSATGIYAQVTPNYPVNTPGYHHSYMGDAMINGGTSLGNFFCGTILVDFSALHEYNYCGSSIRGCEVDFYSLILHEVSHVLGVCSALDYDASGPTISSSLGAGTFTEFDNQFLYFYNGSTFTKMVTGTSPAISISGTTASLAPNSVWLTNTSLSTSRLNQPIYDDHISLPTLNLEYSHFQENFPKANYKSPGFLAPYVVGPGIPKGVTRRIYSLQEFRMFIQLGFSINPGYLPYYSGIPNTPPRTLGQVIDPDPTTLGIDRHRIQAVPAGNNNLYVTTTTCEPVTVILNELYGTGEIIGYDPATGTNYSHTLGLDDPDGDHMTVYDRQLWNINGCGADASNPSPLTLDAAGDHITFTPRHNFVGRANFAFHLGDGTERGSFIVITVDVVKDTACWADPCELVVNGNMEQGTDFNRYDPASGNYIMPTMVDSTNFWQNYVSHGGIFDQVHPDGMEPLEYSGYISPTSIVNTYIPEYCVGPYSSYYTTVPFSPLHATFPAPATSASGVANERYAVSGTGTSTIGSTTHSESNLTLSKLMVPGGKYNISFKYYLVDWNWIPGLPFNPAPAAPFTGKPLELYFNSTFFTGALTPTPSANLVSPSATGISWAGANAWQSYSPLSFIYTGSSSSYMRIIYARGTAPGADYFLYDDVSLTRDLTPDIYASSFCVQSGSSTTLVATVPGGGVTYQWYSGAGTSSPLAGETSNTLLVTHYGLYTLKVTDEAGCTAVKTYNFNPCPAYTDAIGGYPTVISGTISALPPTAAGAVPNAYYICDPLTIAAYSTVTFSNCMVLVAPNIPVNVDYQGLLVITESSHFATCPDSAHMWQGIKLANDWGHVSVSGGSLVEDADIAISISNVVGGALATSAYPYLIETDDAIFNRNKVAVDVRDDPDQTGLYRFVGTIFTSRLLAPVFTSWPTTTTLKLPGIVSPEFSPYWLDNNPAYMPKLCRDGNEALIGIQLHNTGNSVITAPGATTYTFAGITVGEDASESARNLFSKLRNGIEAYNSSLSVRNSTFSNMYMVTYMGSAWGNMGIYTWTDPASWLYKTKLDVSITAGHVPRSEFYENYAGIESINMYQSLISKAYFATSNYVLDPTAGAGQFGIASRSYDYLQANAEYDTVVNCVNGIYLSTDAGTLLGGATPLQGYLYAQYNQLSGTAGASYSGTGTGILIDHLSPPPISSIFTVKVQHNTIYDLFNGISLSNISTRTAYIHDNWMRLQHSPTGAQFGIYDGACDYSEVNDNYVDGTNRANIDASAVFLNSSFSPTVGCNVEENIGRGFDFLGSQLATNWRTNTMQNNQWGFVLDGVIDPQGSAGTGNGNKWLGGTTGWSGTGIFQTFVLNSNPTSSSPLYVRSGLTLLEEPTINGSGPSSGFDYTTTSQIFYASSSLAGARCSAPPTTPYYYRIALERVAQDSVQYGLQQSLKAWISQLAMYKALISDTTLTDSSAILKSFAATTAGSRFRWIADMDNALAAGNNTLAAKLLKSAPRAAGTVTGPGRIKVLDGSGGDSVVAHYAMFYRLYLAYYDTTFGSTDTTELSKLAALCPQLHGAVAYQARTLLRIITGKLPVYNDDCSEREESGGDGGGHNNGRFAKRVINQQYTLLPNPNDGRIQLLQAIADRQPVSIKVYNVVGAAVHSSTKVFEGKSATLNLSSIAPGAYYVVLHDSSGTAYTLKFVKK